MRPLRRPILLLASLGLAGAGGVGGCAARPTPRAAVLRPRAAAAAPHDRRNDDPEAFLALEQILPAPDLRPAVEPPADGSAADAPLDALQLYARARAALVDNQRYTAIDLLEQAARLDPYSFELFWTLGKVHEASASAEQSAGEAVKAYQKAADLRPADLMVQYRLGRLLLRQGQTDLALYHLRCAIETPGYGNDAETAALVDYYLARTLDQRGYARAALDRYALLLRRLRKPSPSAAYHGNVEYLALATRPELVFYEIGALYDKHGDAEQALKAYQAAVELAAAHESGSSREDLSAHFEVHARIVRLLAAVGKADEAEQTAQRLAAAAHAAPEALGLLRDVYHQLGRDEAYPAALLGVARRQPDDRALRLACAEALESAGKPDDAEALLAPAAADPRTGRLDPDVLRRRFALRQGRGDAGAAARLLVETSADHPDALGELAPLWEQLLRPGRGHAPRLAALQRLAVAPAAEAARLYWVSRVADGWGRDGLAQSALEQSARLSPPFAPSYRALAERYWRREDWDAAQKARQCEELAARARAAGGPAGSALAWEIKALSALRGKDWDAAAAILAEAAKGGLRSTELRLIQAEVLMEQGDGPAAEQVLWQVVAEDPAAAEAYAALFRYHMRRHAVDQAEQVVGRWLLADPRGVDARLLQAMLASAAGRSEAAEALLLRLFQEQPEDARVLASLRDFFARAGRAEELMAKLEAERAAHPDNRAVTELLVDGYAEAGRAPDARRVLEAARAAVADDPERLYPLAHLYQRIDQKEAGRQLLAEVLRLDPRFPPANNDLGYAWAEEGHDLERAEGLIRVAVGEEPDNASYLDSLGWVSYQRGKFEEARECLARAIGPAARPDPVVLDHLGDALYRLARPEEARRQWQRSLERLEASAAERLEYGPLRARLKEKLEQSRLGRAVNVAPAAADRPDPRGEGRPGARAKN